MDQFDDRHHGRHVLCTAVLWKGLVLLQDVLDFMSAFNLTGAISLGIVAMVTIFIIRSLFGRG
jgi:hypothetical protein